MVSVSRNAPCPCGSGKKYKYCCLERDRAEEAQRIQERQKARAQALAQEAERLRVAVEQAEGRALDQRLARLQRLLAEAEGKPGTTLSDELEAAIRTLHAHRVECEAVLRDPLQAAEQAQQFFAGEDFAPLRFTAADVQRAFAAVGTPSMATRDKEQDTALLKRALLYLADEGYRRRATYHLLMLLPCYVSAGRYVDACLIEINALQTLDEPQAASPFLGAMFRAGLEAWASMPDQIEGEPQIPEAVACRPSRLSLAGMLAWARRRLASPAEPDRPAGQMEGVHATRDLTEADVQRYGEDIAILLRRDDAQSLYLTFEEVEPWAHDLVARLAPLKAEMEQAQAGGGETGEATEKVREVFDRVVDEMAAALLDEPRRQRLAAEMEAYCRRLAEAGDETSARAAEMALRLLRHTDKPEESHLLRTLCYCSLRACLLHLQEQSAREESQPSRPPANQPTGYDKARVAQAKPLAAAIESLGLPIIRFRKLNGILNALIMQIEDGGDNLEVNLLLLEALRAAIRHQVGEQEGAAALQAVDDFAQAEAERWGVGRKS